MLMSSNKKISMLVVIAICMAIFYLLVGLDFNIFEYQFQSRLKKFILILIGRCNDRNLSSYFSIYYYKQIINTFYYGTRFSIFICQSVTHFFIR